jgi:hypothetical protein
MKHIRCYFEVLLIGCLATAPLGCQRTAAIGDNRSSEAASADRTEEEFPFPPNREGTLLAERLRPANQIARLTDDNIRGPKRVSGLRKLEDPEIPMPPVSVSAFPSIPMPKVRPIRPRLVDRGIPLSREAFDLDRPSAVEFSVGPKAAWPSPDVNEPIPLPILARPATDRASLEDPSGESSLAAALAKTVPERTTPASFLRLTLPDPFEHRNAVRLRTPPPDTPLPVDVPRPPA